MSAIKRKRRMTGSQEDPTMSARKKRDLTDETGASQVSDAPSTVLFELDISNSSPKKKKKKKKKQLDESELENDVIGDNVEDITEAELTINEDVESSQKKKKKKKKKHRDEEARDEEAQVEETNEENEDISPKKRKKKKHNDVDQLELEEETMTNLKNKKNDFTEGELQAEGELSFADIRRMFEDLHEKVSVLKSFKAKSFWANYEFPPFTTEQCKKAFEKIMSKVQKKRTIIELLSAAEKMLSDNPVIFLGENKNVRPITAFKVYVKDHYDKFAEKYPEYPPIRRLNKMAQKWNKLADHKKLKYCDLALAERPKYLATLEICQQVEPLLVSRPTLTKAEWLLKDKAAGLPTAPLRTGFVYFLQTGNELYPNMSYADRLKLLAADYKKLPDEVKKRYHEQHAEVDKTYNDALEKYLATLTPMERDDRQHHTKEKIVKQKHSTNGSKKPPASGYALFYKELKKECIENSTVLKQLQASEKWKALKEEERVEYNRRRLVMYSEWLKKMKEQNESEENAQTETISPNED